MMKLVVAHYGRQIPQAPVAALAEWSDWVAKHMGAETHLTANFMSSVDGLKDGEAYRSEKYRAAVDAELERGNIAQLTLTSMRSKPKGYVAFEYDWTALLDVTAERFGPACILVLNADGKQSDLAVDELFDAYGTLAKRAVATGYGFAAVMPQDFMPVGYAIGLACGGAPEEFVYDANAWRRYARKECNESLRNVFGYNVLNPRHLEIDVGGQRLGDWIAATGDRGRLEPQDDGLFLWTFQEGDDEEAFLRWDYPPVVAVREQLKEYKIFPWQYLPGVE